MEFDAIALFAVLGKEGPRPFQPSLDYASPTLVRLVIPKTVDGDCDDTPRKGTGIRVVVGVLTRKENKIDGLEKGRLWSREPPSWVVRAGGPGQAQVICDLDQRRMGHRAWRLATSVTSLGSDAIVMSWCGGSRGGDWVERISGQVGEQVLWTAEVQFGAPALQPHKYLRVSSQPDVVVNVDNSSTSFPARHGGIQRNCPSAVTVAGTVAASTSNAITRHLLAIYLVSFFDAVEGLFKRAFKFINSSSENKPNGISSVGRPSNQEGTHLSDSVPSPGAVFSESSETISVPATGLFDLGKALGTITRRRDRAGIQLRELGVVFKDLRVVGWGLPPAASLPLALSSTLRSSSRTFRPGPHGVTPPCAISSVVPKALFARGCITTLPPEYVAKHYYGNIVFSPEDDIQSVGSMKHSALRPRCVHRTIAWGFSVAVTCDTQPVPHRANRFRISAWDKLVFPYQFSVTNPLARTVREDFKRPVPQTAAKFASAVLAPEVSAANRMDMDAYFKEIVETVKQSTSQPQLNNSERATNHRRRRCPANAGLIVSAPWSSLKTTAAISQQRPQHQQPTTTLTTRQRPRRWRLRDNAVTMVGAAALRGWDELMALNIVHFVIYYENMDM
ncbi:hypothetical protein EDB89DRAFT_1906038 [Lactarius sanguifluus]|nr:hypothetical protein EDB89DRAFT_1906038 [Lactarius sanguifluus]